MYFEFCIRGVIVISLPCSYIYLYFTLKFKEVGYVLWTFFYEMYYTLKSEVVAYIVGQLVICLVL